MSKSATPCPGCGEVGFYADYMGLVGERMKMTGECFECAFWEMSAKKPNPIVIDHCVYSIGREPRPGENRSFLGMSGRRFDIELFDGRKFTTHNLWSGGVIPERWRERIPNTARFISGASREQVGETTCWNSADYNAPRHPAYHDLPPPADTAAARAGT